MKHTIKLLLLFVSSILLVNCKKITDNVGFSVNGDVIKYGVSFQFWDPKTSNGMAPQNIFVRITGKDASKVYEYGGTKVFNVSSTGILSLGIDPFVKPSSSAPIAFTVEVYAPDYATIKIPITVDGNQKQQLINVTMVNLKNPPNGVSVKQTQVQLAADGSVASTVTLATTPNATTPEISTLTIPVGTKFKDANGSIINNNGGSLQVSQVFYSTRTSSSLSAFPQNSFLSDSIYTEGGNRISGYFQTSGFTSIEMTLNGQEVKFFTNPITVSVGIDPSYINPTTKAAVKSGDNIPIFSYDVTKNRWNFEKNVTISSNYTAEFTTSHLTYYSPAWPGVQCSSSVSMTFNTHVSTVSTYLMDIYAKDGDPRQPIVAGILISATDGQSVSVSDVPTGNVVIKVYPNNANNSQSDWAIRDAAPLGVYDGDACSAASININMPNAQNFPAVTFNIIGRCPGNVLIYPTVPTYYRKAGTNSPYTLLGTVVLGQFTTTNLQLNSSYDFLWLWKNRELVRPNKLIDSLSYTRVLNVNERFPGDTLQDLFCY